MANLSFKEFMDLEEISKPSTIYAALRKLNVEEDDVPEVLKGGLPATVISQVNAPDPNHPNSKLNIGIATVAFDMCKNKRCSKMTVINDPVVRQIYRNKTKNRPAQDNFDNKQKLSFLLGPVKTDQLMFQGNGNPLLQKGGAAAGGAAPPTGGLGGMLA